MTGSRPRPLVFALLVGGLLAAVLASYWFVSRKRARELALDVRRHAIELDACVPQRDALRWAFADDRPAAACAEPARALAVATQKLGAAALLREPKAVTDLGSIAGPLAQTRWDAPARDWLTPPLALALDAVAEAHSLALVIAAAEGASSGPAAAHPPALPEPRLAFELELDGAPLELAWEATSATVEKGAPVALITISVRTARSRSVVVARSLDSARTWQFSRLEPLFGAGSALLRPELALSGAGDVALLVVDGRSLRRFRWPSGSARAEPLGDALALPEGHARPTAGTMLLSPSRIALAGADGGAVVWYEPFDEKSLRRAPPGRLVAATAAPPARLMLSRSSKTGFVEIAELTVPEAKQPWPDARTTLVSYVPELEPKPSADLWCGLPEEQYFTWLARGEKNHLLVAASPTAIYPFRFAIEPDTELSPLCGFCPPAALERSSKGLRVFLPVIRKLAPAPITPPIAFDESSARSASASCTDDRFAAAYVAADRVLAQSTRPREWRFQRPAVLAEPDAHGAPVEPRALGFDDRIVVLWRRAEPLSRRLRIESAEIAPR